MNKLEPKEVSIIQMALEQLIETMEEVAKAPHPFNPDARWMMKDMLDTARSAKAKIVQASGHEVRLDPYLAGDEKEFFTKES